ncbi:vitamin K-dependent protein Z [Lissotriton helveticus]
MKMANPVTASWVLFLILLHEAEQTVFLSAENANQVMQRHKRANFMLVEEILPGNLERECLEERCNYEEAREYFEDKGKTDMFWPTYFGGRQCSSSPCLNNGNCTDTIRSYRCNCAEGYKGTVCQFANNECYPQMSDGCQHFCTPGYDTYYCSCAEGYDLGKDDKSCIPTEPYVCGRVLEQNVEVQGNASNQTETRKDQFPWQVLLVDSGGREFCSGAILNTLFVLTTAECTSMHSDFKVAIGMVGMTAADGQRQMISVHQMHTHRRYSKEKGENDIALLQLSKPIEYNTHRLPICIPEKDFAEHVLIPQQVGIISALRLQEEDVLDSLPLQFQVTYLQKEMCEALLNITHTNRRFCGYSQEIINGTLAGGGVFAAKQNDTWFLTGITGSWSIQGSNLNVVLFTKVSRYITWFNEIMK